MFKRKNTIALILMALLLFLTGCTGDNNDTVQVEEIENEILEESKDVSEGEYSEDVDLNEEDIDEVDGDIEVHFIDVDQGDSIYIKQGNNNMLIDAGDIQYGATVVKYLKDNGVTKLDYVIGTHPHADHIGGLDDVINTFEVGDIILPDVTHTTKTFERLLLAIQSNNLQITRPNVGDIYNLGDSNFTIIAPNSSSYSDLNDYSVGIKLEYGDNSFILTGDAEVQSENEMVNNNISIAADVLKLGHHGSDTSTTQSFLNAVNPKYAVITVGLNNRYGHPDESVLNRLEEKNIEIYRNDLDGTVIVKGDGEGITFETKKTPKPTSSVSKSSTNSKDKEETKEKVSKDEASVEKYIGNKNSKIFHKPSCSSLPGEKNRIYFNRKEDAINAGHRGCKRCNP